MRIRWSIFLMAFQFSYLTAYSAQPTSYQCDSPPFNGIVLMQYENHLINLVREQIRLDEHIIHTSEETVAYNLSVVRRGGDQSEIIPIHQDYNGALERQNLRSDNCLDNAIFSKLNERLMRNCRYDVVASVCSEAQTKVDQVLQQASGRRETAMRSRSRTGPMEFLASYLEPLIPAREEVSVANQHCAQAIYQATGPECQQTFSRFFLEDSELMDLFAKTCTEQGVRHQIQSLTEYLNSPGTLPSQLQNWATVHNRNREKESIIAEEVIKLAELYNHMTAPIRAPSSQTEEP